MTAPLPPARPMLGRPMLLGLVVALGVLVADQASKAWILYGLELPSRGVVAVLPGFFDFAMVWNHGVTFGLLQSGASGQIVLALIALGVVVFLLLWLHRAETLLAAASLGAIAGGALGNVLDRFRFGKVVDFLHLHWGSWDPFPYVFNVGDSAIVIGVSMLLLEGALPHARLRGAPPEA